MLSRFHKFSIKNVVTLQFLVASPPQSSVFYKPSETPIFIVEIVIS